MIELSFFEIILVLFFIPISTLFFAPKSVRNFLLWKNQKKTRYLSLSILFGLISFLLGTISFLICIIPILKS